MISNKIAGNINEFLKESNAIEREYSNDALLDSMLAWNGLIECDELNMSNLLLLHKRIMVNLSPDIAGKFRTVDVSVGTTRCPSPTTSLKLLNEWFDLYGTPKFLTGKVYQEKAELIKLAHISYEHAHPFEDGNGRTGRILLNWHRVKSGLPVLIIHEGEEQKEYYKWF